MKRIFVLLSSTAFAFAPISAVYADDLVHASAGGAVLEAVREYCLEPFSEKTGVSIQAVATENATAQINAQMMTSIQWDVAEVPSEALFLGAANGWFEPLDWERIDPEGVLPEVARKPYGIGYSSYTEGIGYRTDRVEGEEMTSWADFWDIEKFPGPRSLRDQPVRNLEFALLADGVSPEDVYPTLETEEGLDRAFSKLDEIKSEISIWWTSAQQPTQYLASGDVAYSSIFNGRVASAVDDGIPLGFVWDDAALIVAYYAILKGSENVEVAHDLLGYCWTDPEIGAAMVKVIPYPGFAPGVIDLIPEELAVNLSTYPENEAAQFVFSGEFWAERLPTLQQRWQQWRLEN